MLGVQEEQQLSFHINRISQEFEKDTDKLLEMAPAPPPSRAASECGLRFKGGA